MKPEGPSEVTARVRVATLPLMARTKRTRIEDPAGTPALQDAIRHLHGVGSTWVESVPVKDTFAGAVAWEGVVQVFTLKDHPTAKRAYAWSHATTGTKRRFVAVLGEGRSTRPRWR